MTQVSNQIKRRRSEDISKTHYNQAFRKDSNLNHNRYYKTWFPDCSSLPASVLKAYKTPGAVLESIYIFIWLSFAYHWSKQIEIAYNFHHGDTLTSKLVLTFRLNWIVIREVPVVRGCTLPPPTFNEWKRIGEGKRGMITHIPTFKTTQKCTHEIAEKSEVRHWCVLCILYRSTSNAFTYLPAHASNEQDFLPSDKLLTNINCHLPSHTDRLMAENSHYRPAHLAINNSMSSWGRAVSPNGRFGITSLRLRSNSETNQQSLSFKNVFRDMNQYINHNIVWVEENNVKMQWKIQSAILIMVPSTETRQILWYRLGSDQWGELFLLYGSMYIYKCIYVPFWHRTGKSESAVAALSIIFCYNC